MSAYLLESIPIRMLPRLQNLKLAHVVTDCQSLCAWGLPDPAARSAYSSYGLFCFKTKSGSLIVR